MMKHCVRYLTGLVAAWMLLASAAAQSPDSIRIGSLYSDNGTRQFSQAYRNGVELAVSQLNANGGVLGRHVELVGRTDNGSIEQAQRNAQALIQSDRVDVLSGSMLSNVAMAVAKTAAAGKKVFVAGDALSDAITLDKGNRYTFRLRPSTYMQAAMLAEAAARLPVRRWAMIAPNYEYGQSAVANFKLLLKERRPDVEFVAEQWPALGKLNAEAAVKALAQARPQAIFNATFGADLLQFIEEGSRQGLFAGSTVFSMSAGEALGDMLGQYEAVRNWVVLGYPDANASTVEHQRFFDAYFKRFNEKPRLEAIFGYSTIMAIAAGITHAGSTDSDKLITAMRGLQFDTPLGSVTFRAEDQQSSMGAFIGTLGSKDGHNPISDWHYLDGTRYLPSDSYIRGRRPASAMR